MGINLFSPFPSPARAFALAFSFSKMLASTFSFNSLKTVSSISFSEGSFEMGVPSEISRSLLPNLLLIILLN